MSEAYAMQIDKVPELGDEGETRDPSNKLVKTGKADQEQLD